MSTQTKQTKQKRQRRTWLFYVVVPGQSGVSWFSKLSNTTITVWIYTFSRCVPGDFLEKVLEQFQFSSPSLLRLSVKVGGFLSWRRPNRRFFLCCANMKDAFVPLCELPRHRSPSPLLVTSWSSPPGLHLLVSRSTPRPRQKTSTLAWLQKQLAKMLTKQRV